MSKKKKEIKDIEVIEEDTKDNTYILKDTFIDIKYINDEFKSNPYAEILILKEKFTDQITDQRLFCFHQHKKCLNGNWQLVHTVFFQG